MSLWHKIIIICSSVILLQKCMIAFDFLFMLYVCMFIYLFIYVCTRSFPRFGVVIILIPEPCDTQAL